MLREIKRPGGDSDWWHQGVGVGLALVVWEWRGINGA